MSAIATRDAGIDSLGFRDEGGGRYRRDGLVLVTGPLWWSLTAAPGASKDEAPEGWLRRPGPWRADGDGGLSCDLPVGPLADLGGEAGEDLAVQTLRWAVAARKLRASTSCDTAPPFDPDRLTVQVGAFACTGAVVHRPGRLWVDFPLGEVPADLPDVRQRWLRELIAATGRFRLARAGVDETTRRVHVCTDLSGAPLEVAEVLLPLVIDALRTAAAWLLPGVGLLTDATVSSRALQLGAVANLLT